MKPTSEQEYAELFATVPYWFHRVEVAPGIVTPGEDRSHEKYDWCRIPTDLAGKRVLDIGCYEGFFSFECERRGAEVVAIDLWAYGSNGFALCHDLLDSRVEYRQASVYDLDPATFGTFDLVLFLGVLYHLRHPLLAVERVRSVCRGAAVIESQICDEYFVTGSGTVGSLVALAPDVATVPMIQFYPAGELAGDPSNWFSPNLVALAAWATTSGFEVDEVISNGARACLHVSVSGDVQEETPNIFRR